MVRNKVFKIVWDRNALDNFKEILTYLSTQSEQAPKIVKEEILYRLNLLKKTPLIFETDKLKENPGKEFRAFVIYS